MREYSTPSTVEIPTTGNLTDDVVTNGREHPDAVAFSRRVDGRVGATSPPRSSSREVARGGQGPGRRRASRPATGSR